MGWVLVALIVFNILFNITVIVFTVCSNAYRKLKFWCIRRQRKQEIQKRRAEAELREQQRLERIALVQSFFPTHNLEGQPSTTSHLVEVKSKKRGLSSQRKRPNRVRFADQIGQSRGIENSRED